MTDEPQDTPGDLLEEVDELIGRLQHAHGADVAADVTRLLAGIDAVHRAGLTHLMQAIGAMGGDAFVNRLIADPAIRILLMSYDLIAADRRLAAEEAIDAVRGHLHAHGVDIEILEVVGGVVYVRIHGLDRGRLAQDAVVHDVEEALRDGFVGFQELVTRPRELSAAVTIPLGTLRRPVYRDVVAEADLASGAMKSIDLDGHPVLLARIGAEVVAVSNRCGSTPLPLQFSTLDGAELRCSWHGCRYDMRTGNRLDAAGDRLAVYPVRVQDGRVQIAVAAEPVERRAR